MWFLDEWATRRHAESWYAVHSEEDNRHADLAAEIRKEACWALRVCDYHADLVTRVREEVVWLWGSSWVGENISTALRSLCFLSTIKIIWALLCLKISARSRLMKTKQNISIKVEQTDRRPTSLEETISIHRRGDVNNDFVQVSGAGDWTFMVGGIRGNDMKEISARDLPIMTLFSCKQIVGGLFNFSQIFKSNQVCDSKILFFLHLISKCN